MVILLISYSTGLYSKVNKMYMQSPFGKVILSYNIYFIIFVNYAMKNDEQLEKCIKHE